MWTKLGDEFADEAFDLSDAAFRTHVEALIYSNRRLLDLIVPKREVRRFASAAAYDEAVKELVTAGWWEDRGDAWWIGEKWPEWQRDRSQVEHRRAQWSEAQRRRRRHKVDDHSLCLPGNCQYLKDLSSQVSSDDARDDEPDDPGSGRVGYGRAPKASDPQAHASGGAWPDLLPVCAGCGVPVSSGEAAHPGCVPGPSEDRPGTGAADAMAPVRARWSDNPPLPAGPRRTT